MDILTKLQNLIDSLDNSPDEIDLGNLRTILAEAYQVTRQGLNLSNDANRYKPLKKNYDVLVSNHETNLTKLDTSNEKLKLAENQIEILTPLIKNLKLSLIGKITLLNDYSPEMKVKLIDDIKNGDIEKLVESKLKIENDFETKWKPGKKIKDEKHLKFINTSFVKQQRKL